MEFFKRLITQRRRIAELEAENRKLTGDAILLRDGYNAMHRDLQARTSQVMELREKLEKAMAELDTARKDIYKCCETCAFSARNNGTGRLCPWVDDCDVVKIDHWEWRGATDTNVGHKEE